jgi:hypothetical protein
MILRYDIFPKSHDEYCDVIDAISDWLDRNNIKHTKTEIVNESRQNEQNEMLNVIKKHNSINQMAGRGEKPITPRPKPKPRPKRS